MNEMRNRQFFEDIASHLTIETRAFIDGKYCNSASGKKFETLNPATGQVLANAAHCDIADVDRAVAAARKSFNSGVWSRATPEHRKSVLLKLANLVRGNSDELSVLESLNSGKGISDCLNEIANEVSNAFQWYAELIDKSFGSVVPTGDTALSIIIKEPIGVVGFVLPWNFPLLLAAWKLAPALASGCSVVLKPAEQTPLTAIRFAALAAEAGIPDGVLNIVPGLGETTGQAVGRHNDIDAVSFTGSTEIGALFLKYAAESNMKPVGLEMGGKSPLIVLDDAIIDDNMINNAVMAACWNGGQNCSANMRQIVHKSRKDEFLHRVTERVKYLVLGEPLDPATEIGSMITSAHRERILGYIAKGKSEGAKLITGGNKVESFPGFFIEPTIFDHVTRDMAIAREEIFGPVLGIMTVSTIEEALEIAEDSEYGLHASIFTSDINKAITLARRIRCGTISINRFTEGDIKTPFGGYKKSGSLARDNGVEAMDQYQQTKTIWAEISSLL